MSTVIIQDSEKKDGLSAESPPSSDAAAVPPVAALDMAATFGQMTESFRQSQERQARLETELAQEREARQIAERRLDTISGQVDQVMGAISKAAEAEAAAAAQAQTDATAVVPPKEEPPKDSEPPARPSRMARFADWINRR